jgi:hypothetical protein
MKVEADTLIRVTAFFKKKQPGLAGRNKKGPL